MKQPISLVLSGGGARGIAHIGVIEELERQGYEIKSIAGTSMGALVAGVYALGRMHELKDWLLTLDKAKVFSLIDFNFGGLGLVKGDRVLNTMKTFIKDGNIEDMKIPFAAVAADVIHRKEHVFTRGSVYDAIRASIAIPTVLTPFMLGDKVLVDGGVINNLPVNRVKRTPGDIMIAVNVNANIPVEKPKISKIQRDNDQSIYKQKIHAFQQQLHKISPLHKEDKMGYFELINKTISMMTETIQQHSLEKHTPDLMIDISHDACSIFDFYLAKEMIAIGQHAANQSLASLKKQMTG